MNKYISYLAIILSVVALVIAFNSPKGVSLFGATASCSGRAQPCTGWSDMLFTNGSSTGNIDASGTLAIGTLNGASGSSCLELIVQGSTTVVYYTATTTYGGFNTTSTLLFGTTTKQTGCR